LTIFLQSVVAFVYPFAILVGAITVQKALPQAEAIIHDLKCSNLISITVFSHTSPTQNSPQLPNQLKEHQPTATPPHMIRILFYVTPKSATERKQHPHQVKQMA